MAWLRLDDGFPSHPKLSGFSASQKWALIELLCYCARHKTGGLVPRDLSLLPRAVTPALLERAEMAGIVDREEDGHLVIHDWSVYNPSDPTAAERMARWRNNNRNGERNPDRNETVSSRACLPSRPLKESSPPTSTSDGEGLNTGKELALTRLLAMLGDIPDEKREVISNFARRSPEAVTVRLAESLGSSNIRDSLAYVIGSYQRELAA